MPETVQERLRDITITINQKPLPACGGEWVVADFKAAIGVSPGLMLSEVEPFGLNHLSDSDTIIVTDEMRFISHARPGVSI